MKQRYCPRRSFAIENAIGTLSAMLSASKILFAAVLSSAVCITQAKVYRFIRGSPLFHNNRLVLRNFHKEIRCTLNFKAINSGVTKEMKSMIGTRRGSVISLAVLSLEVDGKCMNLTVCDPTGNIDEYMIVTCMNLTVCEPSGNIDEDMPGYMIVRSRNNLLFRGNLAKAILMIKSKGLVYGGKSLPRIMCFLPSSQKTYTSHRTNTEALTDNVIDVNGMETNQQHEQQRNTLPSDCHECPCPPSVHLTRSSLNAAIASAIASAIAFCIPALLCLFSPTGITQDGIQQINLEGASPVSLRSMIGNYFFSQDYSARAFTEIIVVFSVLFFLNFFRLFADSNLWPGLYLLLNSFRLFHLLCYVCCVFQLYMSFLGVKSSDEKTCSLCSSDQHELKCRDLSFPKRITHHLCQQPSIWLTC